MHKYENKFLKLEVVNFEYLLKQIFKASSKIGFENSSYACL